MKHSRVFGTIFQSPPAESSHPSFSRLPIAPPHIFPVPVRLVADARRRHILGSRLPRQPGSALDD